MNDMVSKGRNRHGINIIAKITEHQAIEIFRRAHAGEKYKPMMDEFGISDSQISNIKLGRKWGHVTKRIQIDVR